MKQKRPDKMKQSLEEALFGEAAEATLRSHEDTSAATELAGLLFSPAPSAEINGPSVSPDVFVSTYRENLMQSEARDTNLSANRERQAIITAELEDLKDEEAMLISELCRSRNERKHLRTMLSSRDLAFLQAGQELAHDRVKRLRFDESDPE